MKFKDLDPPVVQLPAHHVFYRVQLIRARASSVRVNGLSLPPAGLMQGRFCLPGETVAYLADSPETALYESLLRRETSSRSLSELRRRCLAEFATSGTLKLADLREMAEPYPVLQSLRLAQTQEFAQDCHAMGLDGIQYASAQHPHHNCLALFERGFPLLKKRGSQRLVKAGTHRLLQVLQLALSRSGVPLLE